MTSRRELHPMKFDPMMGMERRLGHFRPVTVSDYNVESNAAADNNQEWKLEEEASSSQQQVKKKKTPAVLLRKIPTLPLIQALLPNHPESDPPSLGNGEMSSSGSLIQSELSTNSSLLLTDSEQMAREIMVDGSVDSSLLLQIQARLRGIRSESVNYVGYYSAHEESMKNVIQSQAKMAEERITLVVRDAMVDCKRDQLWERLMSGHPPLAYEEFVHLTSLVHFETVDELDPLLAPLMTKPPVWYQNLGKLMANKYSNWSRNFHSANGDIQHTVVLNDSYMGTFALISVDLAAKEGSLAIVYREPRHSPTQANLMPFNYGLIEGFVEMSCFQLWSQML